MAKVDELLEGIHQLAEVVVEDNGGLDAREIVQLCMKIYELDTLIVAGGQVPDRWKKAFTSA